MRQSRTWIFLGIWLALASNSLCAFQLQTTTIDQTVTVTGRLETAGQNYFDGRFVLIDSGGNRINVSSWTPLEYPPTMRGGIPPGPQQRTMQDYLQKQLSVTGIHRMTAAQTPGSPGGAQYDYVEVRSVTDAATGARIFAAAGTPSGGAGAGGNNVAAAPPAGSAPTRTGIATTIPAPPPAPPAGGSSASTSTSAPVAAPPAAIPPIVPTPTSAPQPASSAAAKPAEQPPAKK